MKWHEDDYARLPFFSKNTASVGRERMLVSVAVSNVLASVLVMVGVAPAAADCEIDGAIYLIESFRRGCHRIYSLLFAYARDHMRLA
jgi:hypothetical protein